MKNEYEIKGNIVFIFLNQGKKCVIDTDDLEKMLNFPGLWSLSKQKNNRYAVSRNGQTAISMHRLVMNPPRRMVVDHINHNGLDNRKANLRVVSTAENLQNQTLRKTSVSGARGVRYCKKLNKWVAQIKVFGKIYRKSCDSYDEAVEHASIMRARLMPFSQEAMIQRIEREILGNTRWDDEWEEEKEIIGKRLYGRHWRDISQLYQN